MGIRFYCPNGHKLNVKTFQAGQIGICPVCGVKSPIPLESTRPGSQEEKAGSSGEMPPDAAAPRSSVPPTPAASPPGGVVDPLTEAGERAWYVRPPSGGQFGPATEAVMRNWLAEGRLSADALVWREGWRDWREAVSVFPQLSVGSAIPGLEDILEEPILAPVAARPHIHPPPPRNFPAIVIAVLAFTVVVLIVILLVVLLKQ